MTQNEMAARIAELEALVAAKNTRKEAQLTLKVSQPGSAVKRDGTTYTKKGGTVCLYGLGQFPVALYPSQWERLLGFAQEIQAFLVANEAELEAIASAKVTA